jgi:hypothetical protein
VQRSALALRAPAVPLTLASGHYNGRGPYLCALLAAALQL